MAEIGAFIGGFLDEMSGGNISDCVNRWGSAGKLDQSFVSNEKINSFQYAYKAITGWGVRGFLDHATDWACTKGKDFVDFVLRNVLNLILGRRRRFRRRQFLSTKKKALKKFSFPKKEQLSNFLQEAKKVMWSAGPLIVKVIWCSLGKLTTLYNNVKNVWNSINLLMATVKDKDSILEFMAVLVSRLICKWRTVKNTIEIYGEISNMRDLQRIKQWGKFVGSLAVIFGDIFKNGLPTATVPPENDNVPSSGNWMTTVTDTLKNGLNSLMSHFW
jgi:hypothetical protein